MRRDGYETYRTTPARGGKGTFFYTDCGNVMYSTCGDMKYHGCLCPKCFYNGKKTILFLRGTEEANNVMEGIWTKQLSV